MHHFVQTVNKYFVQVPFQSKTHWEASPSLVSCTRAEVWIPPAWVQGQTNYQGQSTPAVVIGWCLLAL